MAVGTTTMTEREERVMLSAVSISAVVFAAAWGQVLRRPFGEAETSVATEEVLLVSSVAPAEAEERAPRRAVSAKDTLVQDVDSARSAPVPGLVPAPAPRRKVVVVRRSRAS